MSFRDDIKRCKKQIMQGFRSTHLNESDRLTYYLRMNKYGEPFIGCYMYSDLEDSTDINSHYQIVEFNQGVKFEDISENSFLIRELLCFGINYLAFFGGGRDYIVNGIACNNYNVLDNMLNYKKQKMTDVPIEYPVKIYDIKEIECKLYNNLTRFDQ